MNMFFHVVSYMSGSALSSVSVAPITLRPSYIPGTADNPGDVFDVLTISVPFQYIIPSFDVLSVELRQMKITVTVDGVDSNYDLVVRHQPSLCRTYPARMTVKDFLIIDVSDYVDVDLSGVCLYLIDFLTQVREFSVCVKTEGLNLPRQGVMLVWEFEWITVNDDESSESEADVASCEQYNPHVHSDSDLSAGETQSTDSGPPPFLPTQTHTVTFKCIGSTHSNESQNVLSKISKILRDGGDVSVCVQPEPDNQYDSKAIAFVCNVDGKWQRIGYIVRECLDHVHKALQEKRILAVKFSWAKYLVCWSHTGPGFYAGVNISISGEWHSDVVRHQSTR